MVDIVEGGLETFRAMAYDAPTENMVTHLRGIAENYDMRLTSRAREIGRASCRERV